MVLVTACYTAKEYANELNQILPVSNALNSYARASRIF